MTKQIFFLTLIFMTQHDTSENVFVFVTLILMTQHDTSENVKKNGDFDDATQNNANSFFKARD